MNFEFWHLIVLPALFAAGWLCRGFDAKQRAGGAELPQTYSRGVSLLLSGESDKAIDAFVEAVKLDPQQIELHHVLGNLFRARGDFERAIRLHRHIYNRAELNDAERTAALRELAEDYIQAGLFDRAEAAFRRLSEVPSEHLAALHRLLEIYVTEHEWQAAVDTAERLEAKAGENHSAEIAHFHCEKAEIAMKRKDFEAADAEITLAVMQRATPRAPILAGRSAALQGNLEGAVRWWREVAQDYPEHSSLIIGELADAVYKLGDAAGAENLLRDTIARSDSVDAFEAALSRIAAWDGAEAATTAARQMLQRQPSLSAFSALMELKLKAAPDDADLKLLSGLLKRQARRLARYQCRHCGFLASNFAWHCLGCGAWDRFPPRILEESTRGS